MHMLGLLDTGWVCYAHEKSAFSAKCFIVSSFRKNCIIILMSMTGFSYPLRACT
jgi:hypothetical protein